MKFSVRAVIGGAGVAGLCLAFSPITAVALPAYGIACLLGKRRDERLESESSSKSSSNKFEDYDMNSIVRRSYESPFMREIIPYSSMGIDTSPEAMIARSNPRLAASVLSKQIGASIMQTGADVLRETASAALYSGRDFSRVRMKETEKFLG